MTATEMIVAALRKHGRPMTVPELRKYVKLASLSGKVSVARQRGAIVKLGGGARDSIYGLPGQSAPKGDALERGGELGRVKREKPARAIRRKAKRAGGGSAAVRRRRVMTKAAKKAWRTRRANGLKPRSFRPALAADGAILCIGAEYGELELDKATTRVLLDVARKLKPEELAAVVTFLELLDAGEVAA